MAKQGDDSRVPGSEDRLSPAQRRNQQKTRRAEQRRLSERERISDEIYTPAEITARRAKRADKPQPAGTRPSQKTPVSARSLVPERTFSGRVIVLTLITLVVISFLVPTARNYMQQRAEITELTEQINAEEQRQSELYSTLQRWEDPDFVRQQARERINLVLPGEKRYHVVGDLSDAVEHSEDDAESGDESDWAAELWESVLDSADE